MTTILLNPCPCCGHPAKIVPSVKRDHFIAECTEEIDCREWPMTDPFPTEDRAAEAWNRGEVASFDRPAAHAE